MAQNKNDCPIKLICFDLDDTLIYTEDDERVGDTPLKFSPVGNFNPDVGPERVVDGPNKVQVLVPGVREVLPRLAEISTLTWVSMGPQWQMKRFCEAFNIDQYFNWELGAYDRQDKGEKVELCIEHYNASLLAKFHYGAPQLSQQRLRREEVLFIDDNLGYLGRVESYMHGVKVLWAHYRSEGGFQNLYRDIKEQFGLDLKKF